MMIKTPTITIIIKLKRNLEEHVYDDKAQVYRYIHSYLIFLFSRQKFVLPV